MADSKKQSKYVSNEELLAPLQAAFDKYEKKKADEKATKGFTPRTSIVDLGDDFGIGETQDTTAVRSRVGDAPNLPGFGTAIRPLNMGKKSKAPKAADYIEKDKKEGVLRGSEYKSGGKVSSASKRADGCAIRGKTRA